MSLLHVSEIVCRFGFVTALDSVSVEVKEGEVIGVVGANGAGKTTFVNAVTGHSQVTSGNVSFDGENITNRSSRAICRKGVARSFQVSQLFGSMTVFENLMISCAIHRGGAGGRLLPLELTDTRDLARRLVTEFGLENVRDTQVNVLPQGVRKTVDIAMTVASEPKLVFLDEPTSGVSRKEKFELMEQVVEPLRHRQVTILFVEHDMDIVEKYAQRVLAFFEGRILFDGEVNDALANSEVVSKITGRELGVRAGSKDCGREAAF